jgi:hypothetical protein
MLGIKQTWQLFELVLGAKQVAHSNLEREVLNRELHCLKLKKAAPATRQRLSLIMKKHCSN